MTVRDEWHARWMAGRRRAIERALAHVRPVPGGLLVDVAAGDAALTRFVADRLGARPIAQDLGAAEITSARAGGSEALRGDIRRLPFRDGAADVTLAFEIIEHFEQWQGARIIDELRRVTKPGGTLLLSTPNRYALESWKGLLQFLRDGTVWNARDETHVKLYSRRELLAALRARFDVRRCFGYYLVERGSGPLPGTYTITGNPVLANLCFILLVVATPKPCPTE